MILLASCQSDSPTGDDSGKTTTLSARVQLAQGVSTTLYDSAATVRVSLTAGNYSETQTPLFSAHGCDFTGVPVGVPYTLSFQGLNQAGTMIWSGTTNGTTASSTRDGAVSATTVTVVVSNPNDSGPVVVNATYTVGRVSLLPDSIAWNAPKVTGSQKQNCNTTTLECSDTFHLPEPLGTDSLAVQLWTLGIRTSTNYFGELGSSTTLTSRAISVDNLDILLLSRYANLIAAQKASFGIGPSGLVAYYASLILSADTAFAGKPLPVGMNADSVQEDLVLQGVQGGKTLAQLTSLSISLDTTTIRLDVSSLVQAKRLSTADSIGIFPAYPVRVTTPMPCEEPHLWWESRCCHRNILMDHRTQNQTFHPSPDALPR